MAAMSRLMRSLTYAFAGVVILSALAIAYHDAIIQWIVLRLAHQVPGLEVEFDGRFDVTHAFPFTLHVGGVRIAFNGEYHQE